MVNIKNIFLDEAASIIIRCHMILAQIRSAPGDRHLLHTLALLAENLCEPSQMAGIADVYETARPFRSAVATIVDRQIKLTPKICDFLERGCAYLHGLISGLRSVVHAPVDHAAAIAWFEAAPDAGFDVMDLGAAAHLAHDLKSPFGVIKASAEILTDAAALPSPEKLASTLERIIRQADKGISLVASLLDGAKPTPAPLARTRLCLAEAVGLCFDGLNVVAAKRRVQLQHAIDPALELEANPLHLAQILDNLVGNAIKFSPPGGIVAVAGERRQLAIAGRALPSVLVHVADKGRGIAAEVLPFVFMSFVQAQDSDQAQGTGLGLAISKQLCELNGGTIWVRSEAGEGTVFSFALPASS